MTEDERRALNDCIVSAELLRNAIVRYEAQRVLELRCRDLLADIRALVAKGKAKMVVDRP